MRNRFELGHKSPLMTSVNLKRVSVLEAGGEPIWVAIQNPPNKTFGIFNPLHIKGQSPEETSGYSFKVQFLMPPCYLESFLPVVFPTVKGTKKGPWKQTRLNQNSSEIKDLYRGGTVFVKSNLFIYEAHWNNFEGIFFSQFLFAKDWNLFLQLLICIYVDTHIRFIYASRIEASWYLDLIFCTSNITFVVLFWIWKRKKGKPNEVKMFKF